jgi:UDP-N-acetylmuramoyl-tripeptide--D-alanyl-D-alanine ligase
MMTLAQAHALLPGSTLVGGTDAGHTLLQRVHSDTRTLQPGDFFVALRGENFDGHRFLQQARSAGASAALAEQGLAEAGLPGLQVADTQQALQQLAGAWRHRLHLPLAVIAGSNGKTTVTQMLAAILKAWLGDAALATQGNLNNHIGLPLMLLRLRQDDNRWHRAAAFEVGMNHPGEVAALAALAAPTVALVNNAQREHQEFMHSVEAVARENGAVIAALGAIGTVVIPADDAFTPLWRELAGARQVIDFALDAPAAVSATAQWQGEHWVMRLQMAAGNATLKLHAPGKHNAKNALAAAATALALGAPLSAIAAGLQNFRPVAGRSAWRTVQHQGHSAQLVDDSYNANPDSVAAAIEVLAGLPFPRWLILGDMGEVGAQGPQFHQEAGTLARASGIEALWCVGALSAHSAAAFGPAARHFADVPALIASLPQAPAAAAMLVKGSRFMAMERVVQALANVSTAQTEKAPHAA